MNKRALKLAVALSVAELAIFVFVTVLAVSTGAVAPAGAGWSARFSLLLLSQLGNVFMSIATTWYVIFTYFILKSAEDSRRLQAEPFLQVQWQMSQEAETTTFPGTANLTNRLVEVLSQLMGRNFAPSGDPSRYVNLELENVRVAPVGQIEIEIEAVVIPAEGVALAVEPHTDTWRRANPPLGNRARLLVTTLDLGAVPKSARVRVSIKRLSYRAADSDADLLGFTGNRSVEVNGVAVFGPVDAVPQVAAEGA